MLALMSSLFWGGGGGGLFTKCNSNSFSNQRMHGISSAIPKYFCDHPLFKLF